MSLSALHPGVWAAARTGDDPYYSSVVQLSHFDGTNGSTTYTDSSSHSFNLSNSSGSTAAISTAQSQFGGASLLCNGPGVSGGNGITTSGHTIYAVGTKDYTIEFWVLLNSMTLRNDLMFFNAGDSNTGIFATASTATVNFRSGGTTRITSSATLSTSSWTFIAYSRIGTNGVLYVGGNSQGSWTDNGNYTQDAILIGQFVTNTTTNLNGYVDDFRFTIGVGRYSGSTCPIPSGPFPS